MNLQKKAFTFVELIVSATILVILSAIWFYSYIDNIGDSRDSQRKSTFAKIETSLKEYKQSNWAYPNPWNSFNITNGANIVAKQWKLNKKVSLSTLDRLPVDPKNKVYYNYSVTNNKQEYEIAWTLENWDFPIALLTTSGYKTISKNILPTLSLALQTTSDTDITISTNKKLFIFDWNKHNLPYTFEDSFSPETDWTTFTELLSDAEQTETFWQNSDYETCPEIKNAWKSIWDWEYQVRDLNWELTNTWCTSM
jgi:type II secretory pathway pseudopilin PulG